MIERERERERVSVPSNLDVKESWSKCALEYLGENTVSVFSTLCVRVEG